MQPAFVEICWLESRQKKKVHENEVVVLRTCQKVKPAQKVLRRQEVGNKSLLSCYQSVAELLRGCAGLRQRQRARLAMAMRW